LASCSDNKTKSKELTLDNCSVVAHQTGSGDEALVVCDLALVKDTLDFPISELLSSFGIIRLENTDEALTGAAGDGHISVSDNYIGIFTYKGGGYKLFDNKGKYISMISSSGSGPDEYNMALCDSYIDEKNQKIYLLSYIASKILVFDFDGKPQKHIPLSYVTNKGRFIVHPEKETVTMMVTPFPDSPSVIWEQDFNGNILQEMPSPEQFIVNDYNNEVWESLNTDYTDFSIFYFRTLQDTLYHYQSDNNRLLPAFTIHFGNETQPHYYIELPNHYLAWVNLKVEDDGSGIPHFPQILIDKKTLRGSYINIKFDEVGNIEGPWLVSFSRGYITANMEPYALKEQLEAALSHPEKLSLEVQQRIKKLYDSITDDDNNIIFVGKLKN
jgi:hypothetical protein